MRSYHFSEPSAFNSLSFVSSVISSSFHYLLSFPFMIKLITSVGNWGKVWIYRVSLLFPCVLRSWRALALLPQDLWAQSQFSFGSTKKTFAPLFFCILVLFSIFVQLYSLSCVSLSSLVQSRNLSSCILSCLGYRFLILILTRLSWTYFLHLHVQDSALNPCSLDFWRTWYAAVADGGLCSSSAEYPDFSAEVSSCSWRIVGYSWRRSQLLQVAAGGNSPYCDPVTLPGAHLLSQSGLCFEMKVEALAKDFLSHWCSVFGHDRKENWAQGSPCYGVGMRHKILMKQVFNLYCLWGLLQMIISSFPTGKTAGAHADPALQRLQAKAQQWPRCNQCSTGWRGT